MQRAVAKRRLDVAGTRAVTRPAHSGPTAIGNRIIRRLIQAESLAGDSSEFSPAHPPVSDLLNEVVGSPGQSLDAETRSFMESRLGYDFGQVRLHIDSKAAESAAAINAKAYTIGDNIAFGAGQYSPGTVEGRRLLAHELTHILQQASGPVAGSSRLDESISISEPADPSEKEAEEVSALVSSSDINSTGPVQGANSPAAPGDTDSFLRAFVCGWQHHLSWLGS